MFPWLKTVTETDKATLAPSIVWRATWALIVGPSDLAAPPQPERQNPAKKNPAKIHFKARSFKVFPFT